MNKSITIENRLILTHSQWTLHQMHETYWKVPMLSFEITRCSQKSTTYWFKSQSKKSILRVLYLTATCVSCQTWVRQTSGDNGWKLSQDDSSLLEKNDMGGEKKGAGDLSPTLTGESTKQKFTIRGCFTFFSMKELGVLPLLSVGDTASEWLACLPVGWEV